MNRTALVASLALALASSLFVSSAFAQDPQASPTADQVSSGSSDAMNAAPVNSDQSSSQSATSRHRMRHRRMRAEGNAEAALNGDDPKEAQYQESNRMKSYPAVDHGHVAGDPPVIDHSADTAPVANPTHTAITIPPTPQT